MSDYRDLHTGEALENYELEERFDDMLDECYGQVKVLEFEYSTSRALKELDPIAYRCSLNDWVDSELGESLEENN